MDRGPDDALIVNAAMFIKTIILDSQNRFYGVAFTLYGVLLFLCAADIRKYAMVLRCVLWVFFAAGLARLVSIATHGLPPPPVLTLLASELLAPPLIVWWLSNLENQRRDARHP